VLAAAIAQLPEREALVVNLRYHHDLRMKDVGATLGISESRVSQLHTKALAALRRHFQNSVGSKVDADEHEHDRR
jgi:RNA polymerase sigma factor for flagellar operon FliA